jgi:hypothetical protein
MTNPDSEARGDPTDILIPFHSHLRRIERILYIFAKVNPALSYRQGFNELCCVLFYAFYAGLAYFDDSAMKVEALVYFTFEKLLAAIKEYFLGANDSSSVDLQLTGFMEKLDRHLPSASKIIRAHNIHPLYFCFRWLNLMFCQEHEMPNLVLIWDALFSHFDELRDYASYIAVAQVKMLSDGVDEHDYAKTMNTLQKSQVQDIKKLLHWTDLYWEEDHHKRFSGVRRRLSGLFHR